MTKSENKTLTSANDLETMFNDFKKETKSDINFQVSFTKIDFPISNKLNYYIVNLYPYEKTPKQIGHWVTIITKDKNCIVYTCFGLFSIGLLESLENNGYTNIAWDMSADQPLNSKSCGYYCLRYIIDKQYKRMNEYILTKYNGDGKWEIIDKNIESEHKKKLIINNNIFQKTLI